MMFQRIGPPLRLLGAFLALAAMTAFSAPVAAQTPPAIDGDLGDLLQFAQDVESAGTGCAIVITDPTQDVAVIDNQIEPCVPVVGNYYVNGFDQVKAVIVLFQGDLYLGIRTAGVIGDPDGNGDSDTACPTTNVLEQTGIGTADAYQWFLDTNCGRLFAPNVLITVQNNDVVLSGITASSAIFDSNPGGTDLEVRLTGALVNGSPILPVFKGRAFAGNTFDGLGEDLSQVLACPPPDLNLTIEKTADPAAICPGGVTTFSIHLTNPSLVPLQVSLEDELPTGFTYVNGTTSGAGEPSLAGSLLTFPSFSLAAGQSLTVSLNARSSQECNGSVTNIARATGSFSSPCVDGGQPLTVGPVEATADVECVVPSVEVVVDDVASCVGSIANVPVHVTNHSTLSGDVVLVSVPGGQQTLNDLAPGETRDVFVPLSSCESPGQVLVTCTATLSLDQFEGCTDEAADTGTVTCLQAGISVDAEGDEACVGAEATVTLTVTSTSASVQDVTVQWTIDGALQTPVQIDNLGAGASQSVPVPHTCSEAGSTSFVFNATASVDGFAECTDTGDARATVLCRQAVVAVVVGDAAACVGSPAGVVVTVTNQSVEPANLEVNSSFGGETDDRNFPNVPAGESQTFTLSVPCSEAGQVEVTSTVIGSLVSDPTCTKQASDSGIATCSQAGVSLQAQGDAVCVGSPATVRLTVTNTSGGPEDVTIDWTIDGAPQTPAAVSDLAGGESRILEIPYACTEPGSASFAFHAVAVLKANQECEAEGEAAAVVLCREPAVSISAQDAASCVGQEAQVAVSVTNTGAAPENIVVRWTVDGVEQVPVVLGSVAAGATQNFNAPVSCTLAGQVALIFTAEASFGDLEACMRTAEARATVTCRQALVGITVGDAASCVGSPAKVPVSVTNLSAEPANLAAEVRFGSSTVNQNYPNVPAGESRSFNVDVPCEETGRVTVSGTVSAALVSDPNCTALAGDEGTATCGQALVSVVVPDAVICVGQETEVTVTVTNSAAEPANLAVECIVGESVQNLSFPNVPAGESRTFPVSVACAETGPVVVSCTATSSLVGNQQCTAEASDTGTVTCVAACIEASMEDAQVCVGGTATLNLALSNCSKGAETVQVTCNIPGLPPVVQQVQIGAGQSLSLPIQVPCTGAGAVEVICDVVASLDGRPECTDQARAVARVTCMQPNVEITKTTDPQTTQDNSKVTLVVTNTGPTPLNPVAVKDIWPAGLTFDPASLTSDCGVTASVTSTGTATWVTFSNFTLDSGQSCTIRFDLDCVEFDGRARVDTAVVAAWCSGIDSTDPDNQVYAVRDTAYAPVTCEGAPACPRTIGFWRQQCAQTGNGSTKVCRAGMEDLWRCVIERTHVAQFKRNDGTWETREQLAGLSDADLFARMCEQLEGPRRMTHRDMAELQYLGLMLNLCSGNLSGSTPLQGSGGFSGTVDQAVASIENALNTNGDINYWKGVADAINNRQGVKAPYCEDENAIYRNLPACSGSSGEILPSGAPAYSGDTVLLRAHPNPAVNTATQVWYGIPNAQAGDAVLLRIYDVSGRTVRTLADRNPGAGLHQVSWDLRDDFGGDVTAGIYFYRLQVGPTEMSERVFVRR